MFWGLIMEPQKKYTQTVKRAFHISMAALDLTAATDDNVQVMCGYDNRKYLLCTLQKDKIVQVQLDLNFEEGSSVSFITNGSSHVHLTGYLVPEEDMFPGQSSDEEDDEVTLGNITDTNIVSGKRRKDEVPEGQLNGSLAKALQKKMAKLTSGAPPQKKMKTLELLENADDDEEEEDPDVSLTHLLADEDDSTDEDMADEESDASEDLVEEQEDMEEEDEDDEEDDVFDDDEDDEEEEEEEVAPPPVSVNGSAKKGKKEPATPKDTKKEQKSSPTPKQQAEQKPTQAVKGQKRTIEGGVIIEDLTPGTGAAAKAGKVVQVYYEGRLKSGKMFDSTTKGPGFKFRLGRGEVIKGWDVGVQGMKVGGKRRISCPPAMAYGVKGNPPTIPSNSTLVFEVQLKNVN